MLGVRQVEETQPVSKYLSKGINENVTIGPITGNSEGTPYIEITLYKEGTDVESGRSFRLYMSEKAKERSIEKLLHIATKLVERELIDAADDASTTIEAFATKLSTILTGKTIKWFMFGVDQYYNTSGEVKERLKICLPPFASMEDNYRFKWDETNKYLYTKVPVPDTEGAVKNDLPF